MAWKAVMTNTGVDLLKGMLGGARLSITRAVIGSDILSDEEMKGLTDLSNKIPAYVEAVKLADKSCETVQVRISNLGVTEHAVMHQVGLFAKIDDGIDVLLAVYQNDFGEEIPAYAEYPNLLLKFNAGLDISITDNIVVMVNHSAFATFEDLGALQKRITELSGKVGSNIEVSDKEVPAVGVKTHYYITKSVPNYTPYDPDTDTSNVQDGMLDTGTETVRGYVQDEAIHPMAILSE